MYNLLAKYEGVADKTLLVIKLKNEIDWMENLMEIAAKNNIEAGEDNHDQMDTTVETDFDAVEDNHFVR